MKVAQKNPTNPNTRSIYLLDASNYLNMEHSPFGHLSHTCPEPGKRSWLFSPFTYFVQHYVRSTLALLFVMSCLVMYLCAYIYCFFPLFSPVDPETDAAPAIDYVDDESSLPEQPGKPPPL